MKKLLVLISFSVLLLVPGILSQDAYAITFFTDRPSWEAAIGAAMITNDPFDNDIASADVIIFDSGVVSTGLGGASGAALNEVESGDYEGVVDKDGVNAYESIEWDFPNPIIGFGADYTSACSGEILLIISNFEGGGDMTVRIDDHLSSDCDGFFGIVSSSSFQSVRYTSDAGTGALVERWFMDNLSFTKIQLVGGTIIPIDTTSLLLAGAQSTTAWIIPVVIAGIGFAIVISRKF